MEKIFTITLADGTQLAGLGLSGNNFISENEVTAETFNGKLKHVVISCSDENFSDNYGLIGEHNGMELVAIQHYDKEKAEAMKIKEGWYFILRALTPEEIREMSFDARVSYLEMMREVA